MLTPRVSIQLRSMVLPLGYSDALPLFSCDEPTARIHESPVRPTKHKEVGVGVGQPSRRTPTTARPTLTKIVVRDGGVFDMVREEDAVSIQLIKFQASQADIFGTLDEDCRVPRDRPIAARWHLVLLQVRVRGARQVET